MTFEAFMQTPTFTYVVLPLLIFSARIIDQSLGILRIISATKGFKLQVFFAGIFESFIWLVAISQIMAHIDNIFCYIAFASGFATGNVIGIIIEKRLSMGFAMVQLVVKQHIDETTQLLSNHDFHFTFTESVNQGDKALMGHCTLKRKRLNELTGLLKTHNPNAYYSIQDVKVVNHGQPESDKRTWRSLLQRK